MKFGLRRTSLRKRIAVLIFFYPALLPIAFARPEMSPSREPAGNTVILRSRMTQDVEISAKYDTWNDTDILVRVPNGTAAEVIGVSRVRLVHGEELKRFQVKISYQGKEYVGWVAENYLQENVSPKPTTPLMVAEIDEGQCAPLLESYGPSPIASVTRAIRKGNLTVE